MPAAETIAAGDGRVSPMTSHQADRALCLAALGLQKAPVPAHAGDDPSREGRSVGSEVRDRTSLKSYGVRHEVLGYLVRVEPQQISSCRSPGSRITHL